jgi:hypothetical protein
MIIAVDFDGVLVEDAFPNIGKTDPVMVRYVKLLIEAGHEVVLWTCRVDTPLEKAIEWCNQHGLYFCAVNDNAPSNKTKYSGEYPNGTRKVYADYYIDDHNPGYHREKTLTFLHKILEETK